MSWDWAVDLPVLDRAERRDIEKRIKRHRDAAASVEREIQQSRHRIPASTAWLALLTASDEVRRSVTLALHPKTGERFGHYYGLPALRALASNVPSWTPAELIWALDESKDGSCDYEMSYLAMPLLIAEQISADELAPLSATLARLANHAYGEGSVPSTGARREMFRGFVRCYDRVAASPIPSWLLHGGDPFGPATRATLGARLADPCVIGLLTHCATLQKPVPSAKWLRAAHAYDAAAVAGIVLDDFAGFGGSVHDDNDELLRGLVWAAVADSSEAMTHRLAAFASAAATALTDNPKYPYAPKAAGAAVEALGGRSGDAPLRTLARLSMTVKSRPLHARIMATLETLGADRGWSVGEVMELAVDDHGLGRDGRATSMAGDYEAIIEITDGKARLTFARGAKPLKGVPAAVAGSEPDLLKALRGTVKAIGKSLAGERTRVETLFSEHRDWAYADWTTRYLDHPITGQFGRHLIWTVDGTAGRPRLDPAGWVLVDRDGIAHRGDRVRLWHPASVGAAEVAGWRATLMADGVRQPIKQAFREVYLLTPAEERTDVYSNRYAGHILNYRQAAALMGARGWNGHYLGPWDGGYNGESTKEFGGGQWRTTFFYDLVHNDGDWEARLCSTDQVRFARKDGRLWTGVPVATVPPLVFSEAMRDVDLFVGRHLDRGRRDVGRPGRAAIPGLLADHQLRRADRLRAGPPRCAGARAAAAADRERRAS